MTDKIVTSTFSKGGIHPREGKEFSEKCPIEVLPNPSELRIPFVQHIGAPAKVCVEARRELVYGQLVAEASGYVSVPVAAPLPGTVKRIGSVTLPNGRRVPAAIESVQADGFDPQTLLDRMKEPGEFVLSDFDSELIRERIRMAGLVGQGGAAFPIHVKLMPNDEKPIDTLLVNGCECEPYLTADHRAMLEMTDSVIAGARLAAKACHAKKIVICIEANKPDAIEKISAAIEKLKAQKCANAGKTAEKAAGKTAEKAAGNAAEKEPEIRVMRMKTKYPQGGEKQLIYAALGRKVPLGKLPIEVGATVVNVGSTVSIAMAVLHELPLTHRIVTVTGGGIARPANIFVPIGTPIRVLVEHCGGLKENARRVLLGGPMMGFAVGSLEIPVTKGTSGITVLSSEETDRAKETNCIRCGRCVSACPMRLIPTRLMYAARARNWDVFKEYHPMACIECGCCSFSCPAKIPIIQLIRVGKMELARQRQAEGAKEK
ncbi:MAG: RnfABCDGE type electron transport complex subunit C [Planctomycetaceae bacterium]|nr:RnfABCDGE type electron transport complex subunit C [Planctomycetaceae bacterium]